MDNVTLALGEFEKRQKGASFRIGSSNVDPHSGAAQTPHGERRLRKKELDLLMFLHEHAGAVFSRDELLRRVWNYHRGVTTRTVDQTVATLRRKLNDDGGHPQYLITVHGLGYQFRPDYSVPDSDTSNYSPDNEC